MFWDFKKEAGCLSFSVNPGCESYLQGVLLDEESHRDLCRTFLFIVPLRMIPYIKILLTGMPTRTYKAPTLPCGDSMSRARLVRVLFFLIPTLVVACKLQAQVPDPVTVAELPKPGVGHHYIGMGAETVNPADGSLSFDLPIQPPPGRQLSFPFGIHYSSSERFSTSGTGPNVVWVLLPAPPFQLNGWNYQVPVYTATVVKSPYGLNPQEQEVYCDHTQNYVFRGFDGVQRNLGTGGGQWPDDGNTQYGWECSVIGVSAGAYDFIASAPTPAWPVHPPLTVTDPSGTNYQFPSFQLAPSTVPTPWGLIAQTITDRNGNQITFTGSSNSGTSGSYKDTLGRTVVSWSGLGSSGGDQLTVAGLGGNAVVHWTQVTESFPETGYDAGDNGLASCAMTANQTSPQAIAAVSEIDIPGNPEQKYLFSYDGTYARPNKIIFPGGGYVRYLWGLNTSSAESNEQWQVSGGATATCSLVHGTAAITDRYVSYDGVTEVLHQHFSYSPTTWGFGGNAAAWSQKSTTLTSTDLVTGQVTTTAYSYIPGSDIGVGQVPVEEQVSYQDGSGKTWKTVNKTWASVYHVIGDQTVLDNGQGNATLRCYGGNWQVSDIYEYGFQGEGAKPPDPSCPTNPSALSAGLNTSAIGPLRRHTSIAYHNFITHIVNKPDSVTVYDGSGNQMNQTSYQYDGASLTPSGAVDLVSVSAARGNATSVTHWLNTGGNSPVTTYVYYDTGQVATVTDACGQPAANCADVTGTNHETQAFYADSYSSCGGSAPPSSPSDAYLTQVTDAAGHTTKYCYDYPRGLLLSSTDPNNQTTTYTYADPLGRPTQTSYPDRGQTTITYNDAPPSPTATTSRLISSGNSLTAISVMDGIGHVVETLLTSDPDCGSGDRTDTTYDGMGHVHTVSNPYCTTGDPTYGLTTYAYDALGRARQITHPDNSSILTTYAGPAIQVQDEGNGTQPVTRISQTDGLGRLVSVCEVSGTTLIGSSGTPAPCGLAIGGTGFLTTYQRDALDNLLQVNQPGVTARTFVYDSLSRLTNSNGPESGSTAYSYDPNGNVTTKTDARGISTTFAYDTLNRVNSKTYSDGTPTASFFYDNASCCPYFSPALQNTIGRLVYAQAAGQAIDYISYDAMGRTNYEYQAPPSIYGRGSYTLAYGYDLAGDITSATNGMGVTLTYSYPAGRLTQVTSSLSDWYHPATLLSGVHYNALGEMTSAALGNGATQSLAYNNRTWVQSVSTNGFVGVTGSTGSATLSGSEQVIVGAPAMPGTGSVTLSGNLQSKQVQTQAGAPGAGSVTISGLEQSKYVAPPGCHAKSCATLVYDNGTIYVAVNGHNDFVYYGQGSNNSSIASALASAINSDSGSSVSASASGSVVNLTAKVTGSATNYSLSTSVNYDSTDFTHASFGGTPSGSALSGGINATYTAVYDSGTSTITANGHSNAVSWSGSGTTTSSIASALASNINADSGASVTATASGSTVSMTAKTTGASTNYLLASSWTYDSTDFAGSSFTSSNSGSTLTGGQNAGATIYDSGSVWITVNGAQCSVSYGQSSTATSLASSLAQAINGNSGFPVTATASSTTVSLASKSTGSSTNYSLAVGSSTNQSSSFSQPSFSVAASGGSMVGGGNGAPATLYSLSLAYAPNSNVISANDSVNGNWAYAYDPFNRLTCSNLNNGTCASPTSGHVTYTYNYDRFGNRWQQNGPNSMMLTFTGNNPGSPNNNNRMDGYSYDAAGNLLNDGVHSYTYDAENRVTQVDAGATATYVYDANGRRVRKTASASVDYLYDISGHQVAEVNSSGGWNRGEIYAGSTHLAAYNNGTTYFTHRDWLGTERVRSNISGAACDTISSGPFGDGQTISGSCGDPTPMHFTGKERDSESGLDNFGARYNSSSMGRFMSPDPIVVTKRRLTDPQRLNLYAYARNNPLRYTDPKGLDLWEKGCGQESNTCHNDYVGAWDKDRKNFTNTTIQTDSHGNAAGHDVNFDASGIHIDNKYQGVFASNTQATVVNGAGLFSGFQGVFTSNVLGTSAASGVLSALPGHSFSELLSRLNGPNEGLDAFGSHQGLQYRGGNIEGTDIHLSYVQGNELQDIHFDWRYPFGSVDGLFQHTRDLLEYQQRKKTMTNDPASDLVGPTPADETPMGPPI